MSIKKYKIKDFTYADIDSAHLLPTNIDENKKVALTFLDRKEHLNPDINENYIFSNEILNALKIVLGSAVTRSEGIKTSKSRHVWVGGPKGSGKSSAAEEIAKRVGIEYVRIPCTRTTSVDELFGNIGIKNGETVYEEGPLADAVRNGKMVIFEEMDVLPTTLTGLVNTVLDGNSFINPVSKESMTPHPLFFAFATANTMGFGDETGNYGGTQKQNSATMSRFIKCKAEYLKPEQETPMVLSQFLQTYNPERANSPEVKKYYESLCNQFIEHKFADKLVSLANATRNMHIEDPSVIETPLSTRELVMIAVNYPDFENVINRMGASIYMTYSSQLSIEGKSWLEETASRLFGQDMKSEYSFRPVAEVRGVKVKVPELKV